MAQTDMAQADKARAEEARAKEAQPAAATLRPDPPAIEAELLRLAGKAGPSATFCPSEAARNLSGPHPEQWGPLMQPVRRMAVAMAEAGRIVIFRKGRPVDPRDFRGVYRLGLPRED